jgi:hypothetical protein
VGRTRNTHGKDEMRAEFLLENLNRRQHLEEPGIDGRIILEWILGITVGKCEMDSSG